MFMKKVIFSLICLVGMSACSTENVVVNPLKAYDVANSQCKREAMMNDVESNPREDDYRKQAKLSIELGKDGVAQCKVEDITDNCVIRERVVDATNEGKLITLVVHHKEQFELLADCECLYDIDFKMGKLSEGTYHLKVYYAGSVVKYDKEQLVYDGEIKLAQGKTAQVALKQGVLLPTD